MSSEKSKLPWFRFHLLTAVTSYNPLFFVIDIVIAIASLATCEFLVYLREVRRP
jgi:hypothetical protein